MPDHVIGPLEAAVREHPNGAGYQHGWQVKLPVRVEGDDLLARENHRR